MKKGSKTNTITDVTSHNMPFAGLVMFDLPNSSYWTHTIFFTHRANHSR